MIFFIYSLYIHFVFSFHVILSILHFHMEQIHSFNYMNFYFSQNFQFYIQQ